jgi:hypothetical protein
LADDLERLGPTGFQDLAAALAVAEFGSGVQVMGAGRDGGRDMIHEGRLIFDPQRNPRGEVWDGYTVMQVKHMADPSQNHQENVTWLWKQVREELDAWADPAKGRAPVPDYLLVITNVKLTPYPKVGGYDTMQSSVVNYRQKLKDDTRDTDSQSTLVRQAKDRRVDQIREIRFWDSTQIQALLKVHSGVRTAANGFLTVGDVFAALPALTGNIPLEQLGSALRAHARITLAGEGYIYFDEAGSGESAGIPVYEVAIDLPVTHNAGKKRSNVVKYVLDRAEHILKPDMATLAVPRHLIITGAPGNGKTTVSKFIVQAFRAAMLEDASGIGDAHRRFIDGTQAALKRLGYDLPSHRRWPMRIDLAHYVQEHGLDTDKTLLRWIAEKVSEQSNVGEVKPWVLKSWMQQWPWLLILDGLDEVTEPTVRKRLIERVTTFVDEAEGDKCDVLVVLTTRPVGYTENIAPNHFERIDLDFLDVEEALNYGERATRVRLHGDLDRVERVRGGLRKAAADDTLRHLLRTPLQVLILTIIIDASGQVAPDRFSLFWGYYDAVFKRERSKPAGLHQILQDHGQQIQELHERVGFELHVRSETSERADALLTPRELNDIAWQILDEAGFKPSGKDAPLLEKILQTATRRLVLIAPQSEPGSHDGLGFDVRSLQELMAAMHLTTGPWEEVLHRLHVAAPSPHWRNTWLFAAGQSFAAPRRHQHQDLVELVESIDENAEERLGRIVPIGPRLALEIIDDGMVRSLPKWRNRLINHGLKVLREPIPSDLITIARYLVRFAGTGEEQQSMVAEGLRDALESGSVAADTALAFQEMTPTLVGEAQVPQRVRGLSKVRKRPNAKPPSAPANGWVDFRAEILTHPGTDSSTQLLENAAAAVFHIALHPVQDRDTEAIVEGLGVQGVAKALANALEHVVGQESFLVEQLQDSVLPVVHRNPIGELLRPKTD